jgi:predicted phage terminase large subunit-like protein
MNVPTLEQIRAAERLLAGRRARDSLLDFTRLTMPDPADMSDPNRSLYRPAIHHRAICDALERVERGDMRRLIISMPPRHGKSELATKRFPAWCIGRHPRWQVIQVTYSQEFAEDFGRKVRDILRDDTYRQIFPGLHLKTGSQAADRLEMEEGGILVFTGVGGAVTGRGADLLIIDDPVKNREEAESPATRQKVWDFFTSTAYTRLMPGGRIIIIMTRWSEDDLVGRIFNTDFVPAHEADKWHVLELPAIKVVNGQEMALWPEEYPLEELRSKREFLGPRDWSSLYQQKPTPEDGDYFKKGDILASVYKAPSDLPKNIVKYGGSDHALKVAQGRDYNVIGCVGVDEHEDIWIMPDVYWGRCETDRQVDEMIAQMRRHKPLNWWAGRDHITSSLGPFLRKRMQEEGAHCWIEELPEKGDKRQKARAAQGMVATRRIHLPEFAPWFPAALSQMLKFDGDKHDDFVDFLANICRGLERLFGQSVRREKPKREYTPGTIAWIKADAKYRKQAEDAKTARKGF